MAKGGGGVGGALKKVTSFAGGGGALGSYGKALPGFIGDISGSNAAARAAQRAAEAQQAMAQQTRADILDYGKKYEADLMGLAAATPQELAALSRSFSSAEQNLSREQRLLDAIDPALMEASKQALSLLRGESAGINKPMQDMRAMQRQQLVDSLRSQYGPGAESSSIGQRLLRDFDMKSTNMVAENQQSALGQVFGIATSDVGARQRAGIGQLMSVGQGYGALQARQMDARQAAGQSMLGALSGTSQQMINTAGAQYTGDALRAQAQMGLFNQAVQAGAAYGGNYLGAMGTAQGAQAGGASPSAPFYRG